MHSKVGEEVCILSPTVIPKSKPGQPSLSVIAESEHSFDIRYTLKENKITDVDAHKLEWVPDLIFGAKSVIAFSIQNSGTNEMYGTFTILVKFPTLDVYKTSVPVSINSSSLESLASAFRNLKSFSAIITQNFMKDKCGFR